MKANVILAGVGGQGVLSIAYCLCNAALKRGLNFKQSEVHGMAQRGGAVVSHLRISSDQIYSDLAPQGSADLVLSIEPLESLRYGQYLSPTGMVVASSSPVRNIPNYPDLDAVLEQIAAFEQHVLVDAKQLATVAGSGRAANMVVAGAGSWRLGFGIEELEEQVRTLFASKSKRIAEANCQALRLGGLAARLYLEQRGAGRSCGEALQAIAEIPPAELIERAGQDNAVPDAPKPETLPAVN